MIEALRAGKLDVAYLGPFSYVLAKQMADAEAFAVAVTRKTGSSAYHSLIIARNDSGIRSLQDLQGKTFAFVDPSSASGHLFPKAGLEQAGHDPKTLFSRVIFSGSHDASILAVENRKVDAAAVADRILASAVHNGQVKRQDFHVVWTSPDIPESPMVWRKGLDPELQAKLRNAFQVHYQPLIEIESKRCIGAEALVRWCKPNGEMVPPDFFIPLAEESGLILPITDQVIATIMHDLGEMLVADRSLHIAINLAAADVCSGRFLPILQREIAQADVQPQQIWLEVTERSFINAEAARKTIEQARQAGFIVALDDFGTGYSSLQYLQQLSLDVLKIDRSFIDNIGKPDGRDSLVSHVIEMGLALRLALVAEGVDTNAQLAFLSENQVRYAQGWLFGKAMDCHHFVQFYRQQGAMLSTDTQLTT
nr:phosphate/phosphite/phosphonate ABC transporter substrate-binding protein [Pseudomonas mosselii]